MAVLVFKITVVYENDHFLINRAFLSKTSFLSDSDGLTKNNDIEIKTM